MLKHLKRIATSQDIEKSKRIFALLSIRRRFILATGTTLIIGFILFYRPDAAQVEIATPIFADGEVGISLLLTGGQNILKPLDQIDLIATTTVRNIVNDDVAAKSWIVAKNLRVVKSFSQNQDLRALLAIPEVDALVIAEAAHESDLTFVLLSNNQE